MKLLVIRFSSIGDIVLTTPVLRCLKKQRPDVELHYLVKPKFKQVIAANPYIDKIHVLQENWQQMIDELKAENFDEIIDLHHNLRTLRVKKDLKIKTTSFNKLNIRKFIFVKLKWDIMPKLHIVDRYLETVRHLGVVNDGLGLDHFIADIDKVKASDVPASHSAGYIALVIGASFYTKKLPLQKLQELCKLVDHPIVLLGGKEDREVGDLIAAIDPIKIYNACEKFSINESADLLRKAKLVIAHDTGFMHIAAALKRPVIAVWGSTVPAFGMTPYYGDAHLRTTIKPYDDVQVHQLWCRPCTKMGRHQCPQGHFKCMNNLDMQQLAGLVQQRLGMRTSII